MLFLVMLIFQPLMLKNLTFLLAQYIMYRYAYLIFMKRIFSKTLSI